MKARIASTLADEFCYGDYKQYMEDNGCEPAPDGSVEFYRWCNEEAAMCWEDDIDAIDRFEPYRQPVEVTGTLGLWDGRHEIMPVEFASVAAAIRAAMNGVDDVVVEWDNGVIDIKAYHHDGTNCFEVRAKDGKLPNIWEA